MPDIIHGPRFYFGDYVPTNVSVLVTATTLLAADAAIRRVQLTNLGAYPVYFCHLNQTPLVNKGFYIAPNGGVFIFDADCAPIGGISAIADGGTSIVAVGRG